MSFDTIRNHQERLVLAAVQRVACDFPGLATRSDLLADVACVALNRLPPRYIRFETDHSFYQPDPERMEEERRAEAAVREAIQFVRERALAGARA